MRRLPPLDTHAHVDPSISQRHLERLPAVIFAMARSLGETSTALTRQEPHVLWGVGCHPGVAAAQKAFDRTTFARLLQNAPLVGELGLDGASSVPMTLQRNNLRAALQELSSQPRLVSLHSHRAHMPLLDELEQNPARGVILHWWLGSPSETRRAISLGCYFSVNAAMLARRGSVDEIPPERILTETDHPFGDRRGPPPRRPGAVEPVEAALARRWGIEPIAARQRVWRNLDALVRDTRSARLLPRDIRTHLAALS